LETRPDLNGCSSGTVDPLHQASYCGHIETVECLDEAGADLEAQTLEGKIALHLALLGGHYDVAEYLLYRRPETVFASDEEGSLALHFAV